MDSVRRCEETGKTFHAGEKSGPGVLRCKSLGYANPMNVAIDREGNSHRLDVPVGSAQRNIEHALDDGQTVTFFDEKHPRFR